MRAFLAIEIPTELKENLIEMQNTLSKAGLKAKSIFKKNLHWTVKFLGEIDDRQSDDIRNLIMSPEMSLKPFDARIVGIGAFPHIEKPDVIWAGTDSISLRQVMINIDEALNTHVGIPNRSWNTITPHITLMRVKQIRNRELLHNTLKDLAGIELGEMRMDSISLFRSIPVGDRHIYKKEWTVWWNDDGEAHTGDKRD